MNEIIQTNGSYGHGSEVAWTICVSILFEIKLNKEAASIISNMDDSIVSLLALDAYRNGYLPRGLDITKWDAVVSSTQELHGDQWLLVYESVKRNWFPSSSVHLNFSADPFFKHLYNKGASFYNTNAKKTIIRSVSKYLTSLPPQTSAAIGGGGIAGYGD